MGYWAEASGGREGCKGLVVFFCHCNGFPRLRVLVRWIEAHVRFLISLLEFVIVLFEGWAVVVP